METNDRDLNAEGTATQPASSYFEELDLFNRKELLAVQLEDGTFFCVDCHKTGIVAERLTQEEEEYLSDNCDIFLGKVCNHCHAALGYWHVCKFCDVVEFSNGDPHTCLAFWEASRSDKRTKIGRLYNDVMNGFADSFQEDGFTEDVL